MPAGVSVVLMPSTDSTGSTTGISCSRVDGAVPGERRCAGAAPHLLGLHLDVGEDELVQRRRPGRERGHAAQTQPGLPYALRRGFEDLRLEDAVGRRDTGRTLKPGVEQTAGALAGPVEVDELCQPAGEAGPSVGAAFGLTGSGATIPRTTPSSTRSWGRSRNWSAVRGTCSGPRLRIAAASSGAMTEK